MEECRWSNLSEFTLDGEGGLADLPDSCLWKGELTKLFSDIGPNLALLGLTGTTLYVFSGPAGNGAHTMGRALAAEFASMVEKWSSESEDEEPEDEESEDEESEDEEPEDEEPEDEEPEDEEPEDEEPEDEELEDEESELAGIQIFSASDFPARMSPRAVQEKIKAAFHAAGEPLSRFLAFYDMDRYGCLDVVCSALLSEMDEMDVGDADRTFILLFIEDEALLSSLLLSRAMVFRTALPSEKQRLEYLNEKTKWKGISREENEKKEIICDIWLEGITVPAIAEKTEGFSYTQLDLLIRYMRMGGLKNVNKKEASAHFQCKGEDVERYIACIKKPGKNAAVVPVIQTVQAVQPAGDMQNQGQNQTNRALLLAQKGDNARTPMENLEIIRMTESNIDMQKKGE